jgi:hypothetical protein
VTATFINAIARRYQFPRRRYCLLKMQNPGRVLRASHISSADGQLGRRLLWRLANFAGGVAAQLQPITPPQLGAAA